MADKIQLTKQEFDDIYEVIEPDTPEPDLDIVKDKVEIKEPELEPEFLTVEEQKIDDVFHQDNPEESKE